MLPLYNLRKKLGLADLRGRQFRREPTPLELAIAKIKSGTTVGEVRNNIELSRRITAMYRHGVEAFPGYGDSMWKWINGLAADMHRVLLSDDLATLAHALDNPQTTNLLLGFDNPVAAPRSFDRKDRNLLSNEIGPGADARIYLALRRLAEALGAVNIANPETATGTFLTPDEYLDLIDIKLETKLEFPNFYPMEDGLATSRGIVSFRPLQAIYQAARLRQLGASKVLEIGGGLGRTAFYAHKLGISDYTIVDIPLSSVAQAHFLGSALGSEILGLPGDSPRPVRLAGPGLINDSGQHFDVVLNVDSLSEMDHAVAASYVEFAKRQASAFLSINREWDGAPRTADLLRDSPTTRHPYWMRDGYVEELTLFA